MHNEDDDDDKEHDFVDERIALFRPTLDGFVFSDSVPASALHENKDKLRKHLKVKYGQKGLIILCYFSIGYPRNGRLSIIICMCPK